MWGKEACSRAMYKQQIGGYVTTRICLVSGILYNQERFQPKNNEEEKAEEVSLQIHILAPVCVCKLSCLQLSLFHSTYMYISANKRTRKEADYISIHQHCCLSLLYNSCTIWILTKCLEKKLDENMNAEWNKSWKQQPTK